MKKLILAAVGASVALSSIAAAPASAATFDHNRYGQVQQRSNEKGRFDNRRVQQNRFAQNRRWQRGQRFDQRYAMNYRVISNPGYYHLRAAPVGYRWVQSGNDAVLIAITSGIIGAVLANHF